MAEGWLTKADFELDDPCGYQDVNEILQMIRALSARPPAKVGGSRELPRRGAAGALTVFALDYIPTLLDSAKHAGFNIVFRFELRTSDAGTTLTPGIWNVTDNAPATHTAGAACADTEFDFSQANQVQELTLTLAAGQKRYVPYVTVNNGNADVFFIVYLEIRTP